MAKKRRTKYNVKDNAIKNKRIWFATIIAIIVLILLFIFLNAKITGYQFLDTSTPPATTTTPQQTTTPATTSPPSGGGFVGSNEGLGGSGPGFFTSVGTLWDKFVGAPTKIVDTLNSAGDLIGSTFSLGKNITTFFKYVLDGAFIGIFLWIIGILITLVKFKFFSDNDFLLFWGRIITSEEDKRTFMKYLNGILLGWLISGLIAGFIYAIIMIFATVPLAGTLVKWIVLGPATWNTPWGPLVPDDGRQVAIAAWWIFISTIFHIYKRQKIKPAGPEKEAVEAMRFDIATARAKFREMKESGDYTFRI